ncbi:MAG: hypothetical protein V4787_08030 [Pseudomonadota bacterium]
MASRRVLLWLLLFALLAAQTLGVMHRVVHPSPAAAAVHASAAKSAGGALVDLLASHDGAACQLFDQMCQGGFAPQVAQLPPAVVLPSLLVCWFQDAILARWAALFEARGPPSLR